MATNDANTNDDELRLQYEAQRFGEIFPASHPGNGLAVVI
jgi:hypothetical protein